MTELAKQSNVSIVPSADLQGLAQSLGDLVAARDKLPELEQRMRTMPVTNRAEYAAMGLEVQEARSILKRGEEIIRPYLNKVKVVQDYRRTQMNEHEAAAKAVADIGARKQEDFNRE